MVIRSIVLAGVLFVAAPAMTQAIETGTGHNTANSFDTLLKFYPPRALAAHEEGAVGFTVTLDGKGEVTGCQVTHSSGHPLLDQETCALIALHAQFKPDPGMSSSQVRTSEGLIAWKLPASGTTLAAPKALAQGSAPEKVVCKKTMKTGSLASFERTCMTPSEWAKQSDEQKADWEDIQGKKGSTSGN
ncbi:MAG TPA: energy transducer TonB [Sphingomicrobium sp.]|nr:energy transducer TonB [Sphingomicrobium sp.]